MCFEINLVILFTWFRIHKILKIRIRLQSIHITGLMYVFLLRRVFDGPEPQYAAHVRADRSTNVYRSFGVRNNYVCNKEI